MATAPLVWKVCVELRGKDSRFYSYDIPGSTLSLSGREGTIRLITLEITPELLEKITEVVRKEIRSSLPLHPPAVPLEIIEYFYREIVLQNTGVGKYWIWGRIIWEPMPDGFLEQPSKAS